MATVQITMVGELMKVEDLGTQTDLVLDDGTGTINVKLFRSGDEDSVRRQQAAFTSSVLSQCHMHRPTSFQSGMHQPGICCAPLV